MTPGIFIYHHLRSHTILYSNQRFVFAVTQNLVNIGVVPRSDLGTVFEIKTIQRHTHSPAARADGHILKLYGTVGRAGGRARRGPRRFDFRSPRRALRGSECARPGPVGPVRAIIGGGFVTPRVLHSTGLTYPTARARLRPPLGRAGGSLEAGGFAPASYEAVRLSGAVGVEGPLRTPGAYLTCLRLHQGDVRGHFFDSGGGPSGRPPAALAAPWRRVTRGGAGAAFGVLRGSGRPFG